MQLSLPLILVICLIGYGYSMNVNDETKSKVICEEYEFSQANLNEEQLNKVRLVKLKSCLTSKKKQIAREEEEKKSRVARSANDEDEEVDNRTFAEIFKTSAAFKRVLNEYMKLKENVIKRTNDLQHEINAALINFAAENDEAMPENHQQQQQQQPKQQQQQEKEQKETGANTLTCEKPNQVIKIKQAVLTNKNHEKLCSAISFNLNVENMDDDCYNKEEATRRLAEVCNGQSECDVSISVLFNTLCDCTEKKQLEVEWTCEAKTAENSAAHKLNKRALYYQNDKYSMKQNDRLRNRIMDYYDRFGFDYYYDDYYYYDDCLYDFYGYGCDYYDYYGYDYYSLPFGGGRGGYGNRNGRYGNGGSRYGGASRYGNDRYGGSRYGNDRYGGSRYGNDRYGGDRYGSSGSYGGDRYGSSSYGGDRYGSSNYGGDRYGSGYGGSSYGTSKYGGGYGGSSSSYGGDRYGSSGYNGGYNNDGYGYRKLAQKGGKKQEEETAVEETNLDSDADSVETQNQESIRKLSMGYKTNLAAAGNTNNNKLKKRRLQAGAGGNRKNLQNSLRRGSKKLKAGRKN